MPDKIHVRFLDKPPFAFEVKDRENMTAILLLGEVYFKSLEFRETFGPDPTITILSYYDEEFKDYVNVGNSIFIKKLAPAGVSMNNAFRVSFRFNVPSQKWLKIPIPTYENHETAPKYTSSSFRVKSSKEIENGDPANRGKPEQSKPRDQEGEEAEVRKDKKQPKKKLLDKIYHWTDFHSRANIFSFLSTDREIKSPQHVDYTIWDEVSGLRPFIFLNALRRLPLFDEHISIESGCVNSDF
jgi:hypothetical protein